MLIKKASFYFYEQTDDLFLDKETLCIKLINIYLTFLNKVC